LSPFALSSVTLASVALPAFAADATGPAPIPPSIDELLQEAETLDTALSPDGSRVAILVRKQNGQRTTSYLVFYEIAKGDNQGDPVVLGDIDAYQLEWANEERLLIWLKIDKDEYGKPSGMTFYDQFVPIPVRRIISVGVDGRNGTILFSNQGNVLKRQFNLANVVDRMNSDPRNILMQMWDTQADLPALYRVDVYSGQATLVEKGRPSTEGWFTQDGVPVIRFDGNPRGTVVTVMVRSPGEVEWKTYRKIRRNELEQLADLEFLAPTPEPGVLLMLSMDDGANMPAIRKFDTRTLQLGEVFAQDEKLQLRGVFVDEADRALAVSLSDDRANYRFLDPKLAAHYAGLNDYFGKECNVTPYDVSNDHKRFIFHVEGPRSGGAFWLYDLDKRNIELMGEQRPWLTKARLAPMKALSVKTRDGTSITAYLTTPATPANGPRPLVVVPHGGPETRDTLSFDYFAQAFAAQGWLVLQPNFRGSGGYGRAFADQGRKHWGDLMQHDVEDAVAQVAAEGLVDPNRIAICGASYGGYAALMGAVLRPDLYKAVVSIAGVADLDMALDISRAEDGADSRAYEYWVRTIGDPKADQAMLKIASPALRASEIKAPVLLIHGTEDTIVSPRQSRAMAKALKSAGKPAELIEMKGVGHRDWQQANWKLVLEKSVAHIQKSFSA
jgi:dipeptidyl aminopeptidase/acylaminoacyl peptidase